MTDYLTLDEETLEYGRNNFIELARKQGVENGESFKFISVSKGFIKDGDKVYQQNTTVPHRDDVLSEMRKTIDRFMEDI